MNAQWLEVRTTLLNTRIHHVFCVQQLNRSPPETAYIWGRLVAECVALIEDCEAYLHADSILWIGAEDDYYLILYPDWDHPSWQTELPRQS
jgi:hypothetical protein